VLARVLVVLSLLQAALLYLPLPTWTAWKLHYAAIEGCLVGVIVALVALALGDGPYVRGLAIVAAVASSLPALSAIPVFYREHQPFSLTQWITGQIGPPVPVTRDVEWAPGLAVDVYPAPGPGPHPWVMVVHGGSWRSGDKGEVAHVSHAMARAGFTVLDVRYRLSGEARFPAAIADVRCLYGEARARAAELGIDPDRGALLGRSAGAEIALVAAYSDIAPSCGITGVAPRAVVSIYGPTDLAWGHDHPFVPDVVDGPAGTEQYLGGSPREVPEAYRLATPMTWVGPDTPPTLIVHGTGERCVRPDNAEKLRDALLAAKRPVRTVFVPFADHGFDVRPGGFGEQLTRGVILDFLREHL
jgi:acetyl esterase/lipase